MTLDPRDELSEISKQLTVIDVDDSSARRIVDRARLDVGRGPSLKRFVEPVLVAIFATSVLGWVTLKLLEVFG